MSLLNILTLIAAVANFTLGMLVFLRNPKKALNATFALFAFTTSFWCLLNFIFWFGHNPYIFKSQYAFGAAVIISSIIWVNQLLRSANKYKTAILYFLLAVMFVAPFLNNLIISEVGFNLDGTLYFNPGSLFDVYSTVTSFIFVYLFFELIKGVIKSRGVQRTQINYVLLGAIGFGGISMMFSFVLPFFGIRIVAPFDAQSSLIFVGASTYAMARHRLMDIRMVVARSLAYIFLLATLALFYAGGVLAIERFIFQSNQIDLAQGAVRTILAVIMAFSFQPLRRWITKKTDKIFFKNAYDPQKLLDELSHTMGSTIVLIELLYKVTDILIQNMKVSRGLFVLLKDEKELYTVQANGYTENPKVGIEDIIHLAKDGTVVYDELAETSKYKSILRKYEAAVSLPLKTEKEIVGVFLIGEKNSGDMFNQQDLRILEIIAPEVSVAIENAKSYEEISRFNVTLRNEVKRATQRLKDKNQQLRELDIAKDEFISMASHQLRTPLTAIKGYLSMLLEGDAGKIEGIKYDFINEAYSGANRMVGLINDLLNVSRMETGRFFLEPENLKVDQIINEEVHQLTNTAKEKGLYLKVDKQKDDLTIWADETKIRQVIMNFIDNAIHYTSKGGVTVSYGKEKGLFVFSVKDTGIGVPREQQKKLFEKFFRADNARHSRPDGTGLGLFLAKRVVEDHNGSIFFSSIEGQGSVFGFRLPMKKTEQIKPSVLEPKPVSSTPANVNGTKTDIAEDDPIPEQKQAPIPIGEPKHALKR